MRKLLRLLAACFVAAWLLPAMPFEASAQGYDMAALRGAIAEMRASGMAGPELEQMEAMLRAFEADDLARGRESVVAMRENRLRQAGMAEAADCDGYWPDAQAFAFCAAAAQAYLAYIDVFRHQGDSPAALQIYAAHTENVDNLVNYVENFMTRPKPGPR